MFQKKVAVQKVYKISTKVLITELCVQIEGDATKVKLTLLQLVSRIKTRANVGPILIWLSGDRENLRKKSRRYEFQA